MITPIFSDLHIHNYLQFNHGQERLDNCLSALLDVLDAGKKFGSPVLFAGDLFDQHKVIPTDVFNTLLEVLTTRVKKDYADVKIVAISGNHDYATKNFYGKPASSALAGVAHVLGDQFVWLDRVKAYALSDDIVVAGVPYYDLSEHFERALMDVNAYVEENFSHCRYKYLLIHQTPGSGPDTYFGPSDLSPTSPLLGSYTHVFCGHIHQRMQLTPYFTIVGNTLHREIADSDQEKGFLLMNLLKPEKGWKLVPTDYPAYVTAYEGAVVEGEDDGSVIVRRVPKPIVRVETRNAIAHFNTSLRATELITNYWKEVDGQDQELLDWGLSFCR